MKIDDYLTESTIYCKTKCDMGVLIDVIKASNLFEPLPIEEGRERDDICFYREKIGYRQLISLCQKEGYIQIMVFTKTGLSNERKHLSAKLENDVLALISYAELES